MIVAALIGGLILVAATYMTLPAWVRRDPVNPALILVAAICVLTAGRALYVLDHGAFFLIFDTQFSLSSHSSDFALGVLAQLGGVALFVLGVAGVTRLGKVRDPAPPADTLADEPRRLDKRVLQGGLLVGAAVSLVALALLIEQAGGLSLYLDALRNRQFFFAHEGAQFVALSAFPAAVLAWFTAEASPGRSRRWWAAATALICAASGVALAGGARSPLVFLFLLPLLLVFHTRVRRLDWRAAGAIALILFVAVSGFRVVGRDSSATASGSLYAPGVVGFLTNAFASPDSRLPDTVAVLRAESLPSKEGRTALAAVSAPVPRGIWPDKPRGGNEQLAATLYPASFRPALGLSLAGEAIWNFGWPGLILFGIFGAVVGAAYRGVRRVPGDPLRLVLYAATLGVVLIATRGDLFAGVLGFFKAFAPAILLLGLGIWVAARGEAAEKRPTRTALEYLTATLAGRGAVFLALAVAAAVLPVGDYARFALAYQSALFIAYQIAYPFNVAGYRLGPRPHPAALLKRLGIATVAGAGGGALAAAILVPEATGAVIGANAAFAAAASLAMVALGQAQAAGFALSFARWNAAGSLVFLALAGLAGAPAGELIAAAAGMVAAPAILLTRLSSITANDGEQPIGRPEPAVFGAGLIFNLAFVLVLVLVNDELGASEADAVAFLFTLLLATLALPLQLVSLTQPRLIDSPSETLRRRFSATQGTLATAVTLAGLAAAGLATAQGWTEWELAAPIAFSALPIGFGLAGGNALLVSTNPDRRLLLAPAVFTGLLLAAAALGDASASQLTLAWAAAATAGSLVQTRLLPEREIVRRLARGLLTAGSCLAIGYVEPLAGGAAAAAILALGHRSLRFSLLSARDLVAAHR